MPHHHRLPYATTIVLSLIVSALAIAGPVTITPGQLWPDDRGEHVNAHCGDIVKSGDRYYWFGEYRDARLVQNISCYVSSDLAHWKFDRLVLTPKANAAVAESHLERPKVLFNEKTKQFVMWMHRENTQGYREAQCAVATCDTIDGDYVWQGAFNPNGNMSRDCTLFKDDDGRAYFISSSHDNADMILYQLSDDYLKIASQVAVLSIKQYREAPCLFKRNGTYYLITSFCTGTWPNTQYYSTAKAIAGPWSPPRKLAGDDTWNTYYSQGAFVLPVQGSETTSYIYCADRWQIRPMRHVWLPLQFADDGSIVPLRWADAWTLDADTGNVTMPKPPAPLVDDVARGAVVSSDYDGAGVLDRRAISDRSYSHLAGHEPASANDSDVTTYWCANDNLPGHWWQVDLGKPQAIDGVKIIWHRTNANYSYEISTSADGAHWDRKAQADGKSARAPTTRAATRPAVDEVFHAENVRFVRVTITAIPSGYDWPGFAELKVLDSAGVDLAAGQPASADSDQPNTRAAAATDGDSSTAWTIDDRSKNHWLKLELAKPTDIAGCRILWEAPGYWYQYKIETSADDKSWSVVVDQTASHQVIRYPQHDFSAPAARYVRLTLTDYEPGCWPGVRAFEVLRQP